MLQIENELLSFYKNEKTKVAIKVGNKIREVMGNFLHSIGFIEIPPVIISPFTDPLSHETIEAKIRYYENDFYLTKSMIFHKQIALLSFEKIFSFSPNVRLEKMEKGATGKHLIEFTQLDVEARNAKREDMMKIVEKMIFNVIKEIEKGEEADKIERVPKLPSIPFERIKFEEAYCEYGENYEDEISNEAEEPVWIIDFPIWKREFYDREYEENAGILADMDLIYPEGFGEALSGGEREYKYDRILERMRKSGIDTRTYSNYLMMAKYLYPSAGFGIGIERLTRYICGFKEIKYANLFPKIPGEYAYF